MTVATTPTRRRTATCPICRARFNLRGRTQTFCSLACATEGRATREHAENLAAVLALVNDYRGLPLSVLDVSDELKISHRRARWLLDELVTARTITVGRFEGQRVYRSRS